MYSVLVCLFHPKKYAHNLPLIVCVSLSMVAAIIQTGKASLIHTRNKNVIFLLLALFEKLREMTAQHPVKISSFRDGYSPRISGGKRGNVGRAKLTDTKRTGRLDSSDLLENCDII